MKTSYISLVCAGLLLFSFPALQRAQETVVEDQADGQGEQVSVASPDSIETSGTVATKAGADVLFASPSQTDLSLGLDVKQSGTSAELVVSGTDDAVLLVLDGDGQTAPAGSFNAKPFDIAVWHGSGSTPLAGQSVIFTVEQGGGLLSETTAAASGSTSLTLASDDDGTVQAYYQHGPTPGVLSSIRVDAVGETLTLQSLSISDATAGGYGKSPLPQKSLGASAPMSVPGAMGIMGTEKDPRACFVN